MIVVSTADISWKGVSYGDSYSTRIELPFPPFVGLRLNRILRHPDLFDEWVVTKVEVDLFKNVTFIEVQLDTESDVDYNEKELEQMHRIISTWYELRCDVPVTLHQQLQQPNDN